MSAISASLVKELREKTNAGMMDCKNALVESNGDLEAAEELLRKKGIARAGKKADREAKEGLIVAAISGDGATGLLLEVNCETDFVAKNDNFRNFADSLAQVLLATPVETPEDFLAAAHPSGGTVDEVVKAKIAEIGENIQVRRLVRYEAAPGAKLATYIHMQGRVGVLLEATAGNAATFDNDAVLTTVKDITLHIAASSPVAVGRDEVDPALVAKEREIAAESDRCKGKPQNVVEKIVDGMIGKFYSQICLLEQGFVKNPDQTISDLLAATGKQAGDTLGVTRFRRMAIGEAS